MKSIDKDEPVSTGLFNRMLSWLTRDPSEDRRPKHPRPAVVPRPQVPRPIDVGRPPRGGSGALPAPPPDCPYCEVGKVEPLVNRASHRSFGIGRFRCLACKMNFTQEDAIAFAKVKRKTPVEKTTDAVKAITEAARTMGMSVAEATHAFERMSQTININVAGFVGNEAELAKALEESLEESDDDLGDRIADAEDLLEEDAGAAARAYREERNRSGGVPMCPDDSDAEEKKDLNQIVTEKGWRKPKVEPAPKTSSAWWTAIKWVCGVGASIGAGWLIEWAVF